jgi:diguanylate cyclase (GGDEF)-like protein
MKKPQSTIDNLLTSGHTFASDEILLKFRFRMLNSIMITVAFFAALFALLHDTGINPIGSVHASVDYFYAAVTLLLFLWLRRDKGRYNKAVGGLLLVSLLVFTSALLFVPQDEFRIIWFYLLIFVAYITGGIVTGWLFTLLSIADILLCHTLFDLRLSDTAVTSALIGLLIGSLLARFHTRKIDDFEALLIRKNRELEAHAAQDYLTGIMNRRVFLQSGQHYLDTARRQHDAIAFIMIDIDHFKRINDTYGHSVGDNVLMRFADTVGGTLRSSDLFGRIGGEEFGIILYESDEYRAEIVAEKIRKAIATMVCPDDRKKAIRVTASIGIGLQEENDTHLRELQSRADKALYTAKKSGRNKTVLYIPSETTNTTTLYSI